MQKHATPGETDASGPILGATPHPRVAYSPAEFAALFKRHPTWAYRLLYKGRIKAIRGVGRILIPARELERLLADTVNYGEILEEAEHQWVRKKKAVHGRQAE